MHVKMVDLIKIYRYYVKINDISLRSRCFALFCDVTITYYVIFSQVDISFDPSSCT